MLAPAIYMLQVYDRVLVSANTMTLLMLTILVLGIFVFIGLLEWVRSAIVIRLGTRIDMQLNQRVFNAAFASQLRGHKAPAAQALNDLTSLRQFATGNALFAFFDAPSVSTVFAGYFCPPSLVGCFGHGRRMCAYFSGLV